MKKFNFLSNLWSLLVGSRKDDGSTRYRLVIDSLSTRYRVWQYSLGKIAAVVCMLLTIGVGNAWGGNHTWSYTFASGNLSTSAGNKTFAGKIDGSTNKSVTWACSAATYIGWDNTKGIQIGSGKSPQKSIAWTMQTDISNIGSSIKITSITINVAVASSGGGKYILSAGTATSGASGTAFSNTSNGDKTYNITTDITSGNIVISLQSTKDKAMYIKSVTIGYADVGGGSTCETPTFSPAAGTYCGSQSVTISSTTTGSTIYYTTDNSTPTTSSSHGTAGAASATVTVSSSQTLKAIAVKDGMSNSATGSAAYTINNIANTQETAYTVAEARDLIDANVCLTQQVYVKGYVSEIVTAYNGTYGNISFNITDNSDGTGDTFEFFRNFKGSGNTKWTSAAEAPQVGNYVVGYGTLTKYSSTYELAEGNYCVVNSSYTITAVSNNDSYGTVSLTGKVITATPESGYRVSTSTPYTVSPANSATVSQNGNEFTVTPSANTTITINFEAIPTHDIHFNTGGLVVIADAEDIQEGDTYDITETPAASLSGDCEYSTFVGWTTASSIADASICPSTVTSVTMSTSDVTLYAVYSKTTGSGFKLSLNSGGTEYYIGAKGSGAYMSAVTDAADAVVFTFATGYLSFDDSGTKTYISSAGDNTTLTVGTSVPSSTWTESGTTTFTYQSSAAGTRYLGFNSGANPVRFAPYGSTYAHEFTKHNAGTTTYSLSANCNAPRITVSLTEIDFGDVKVGTSPTATFTVSGTNLSEDIGLAISGPQAGRYSVSESSLTPNAGGTVAETTITVTFSPTASADHRAQVNITSEGATTKTVSLKAYSKWEVTWMKNGGNFTTTLVAGGQKPTFPDPAPTSCDASSTAFRGWTQTPWSGKQSQTYVDGLTDDDTKVHVDNTTMTTVSSNDVVYHAVFAKATGSNETDVINYSATSSQLSEESESAYVDNFTITGSTGAQYRIHSMGTSSGIALRWNTNGFLYCSSAPTSGAKLSSVTITTTADKSIGVYASNSAYSGDTKPSATSLGTVVATSSGATKNITDSYAYIGLTGTTSSTVISSITITYGGTTYSDYMTTCCETPTLAFVSSPYATVRQDIGGASTSTWAEVDVTFTSNSTGTITAGTPYQLAANKWQVYETTGGSACVATHATFEVLTQPSGETPGTGKFSVKTTSAGTQTGQGTYRIALTQAATDESHGNYCETTVYGFVDVTLRDKFVDNVNGNGTVNKDGHGAQLATPALSEFGTQVENACHSEGRKLKGWIKETDLKTQYENGNSTRVQTIDGLCESCDDGTDQISLIVAPGTNVTMSGATWYAVWAYER